MPVEETGNMLLMIAMVVEEEGYIDESLLHFWPLLTQWAEYLVNALPDPGWQLCTDDFTGNLG